MSEPVGDVEKLDPEEMFKSLNGFEEIAIEQHFRRSTGQIAIAAEQGDAFQLMRALLFVAEKRGGMNDTDAFRTVMLMRTDAVTDRFVEQGPAVVDEDEGDEGKA